ncbi:hypothetical protein Tco_0436043 [Tanacetum coccineum]
MLAIQAEEGEGSGHPSEPQPPPSTAQPIHEEQIPNVVSSSHQKTQTPMQALNQVTELPQTSKPIPNVADEAVYEEWDNRVERATTTVASLDVAQASGGSPRYGSSFGDRLNADKESIWCCLYQAYPEDQPKDQLGVFSAAKVLADAAKNVHTYTRRRRAVSTSSGGVSTASRLFSIAKESVSTARASMPVSTAGMVQEVNKDKGKGIMTESEPEQTKTKLQQRQKRAGYEAAVRLQE